MFFCFSHTSPPCNSSPRVFFLLDPQVSTQNLEFVATRLSSPGWVAICLSPWVASTVGYYNQDQLWIISYKVQPLLMVYSAFLGQCMRQFRFLCPRQKINSCKKNRRRFSRHDFLEVILPTYSRPQYGQNVSLESYYQVMRNPWKILGRSTLKSTGISKDKISTLDKRST